MALDPELVTFGMTMSAAIVCVALCLPAESQRESVGGSSWLHGHNDQGKRCCYIEHGNERTAKPQANIANTPQDGTLTGARMSES